MEEYRDRGKKRKVEDNDTLPPMGIGGCEGGGRGEEDEERMLGRRGEEGNLVSTLL